MEKPGVDLLPAMLMERSKGLTLRQDLKRTEDHALLKGPFN